MVGGMVILPGKPWGRRAKRKFLPSVRVPAGRSGGLCPEPLRVSALAGAGRSRLRASRCASLTLRTSRPCRHVLRTLLGLRMAYLASPRLPPSRGRAQPFCAPLGARRAAPWCWRPVSGVDHPSLIALQSRPSLLSRSPAAVLDRLRCAPPAWARASGQGCGISSAAARPPVILALAFGFPAVTPPCSAPKPRWRPFGGAPCAAIL